MRALNNIFAKNYFLFNYLPLICQKPNLTYVDIGSAHHSNELVFFLQKYMEITQYCYDPFEEKNILKNKFNFNFGLSNDAKNQKFYENENPQTSSFYPVNDRYKQYFKKNYNKRYVTKTYNITTNKLDNMKIDNLNFIKIDTQGYNYEIIKGCENLLDVFSPIILIELWNFDIYKQQYNFGEIISLLKNKGYIMLDIEKSHQWNFEGDFTNFSRSKKAFVAGDALFIKEDILIGNNKNMHTSKIDFIIFLCLIDIFGFRNLALSLIQNKYLKDEDKEELFKFLVNLKSKTIYKITQNKLLNFIIRNIFKFNIHGINYHY